MRLEPGAQSRRGLGQPAHPARPARARGRLHRRHRTGVAARASREWGDVHLTATRTSGSIRSTPRTWRPTSSWSRGRRSRPREQYEANLGRQRSAHRRSASSARGAREGSRRQDADAPRAPGSPGPRLEEKGLTAKLGGWLAQAAPLQGRSVVTYHKSWIYFASRFGLAIPVEIEEKPGIPPSARHRDAVVALMKQQGVHTVLEEVFYDQGAADYLAAQTGAHEVIVPIDVGEEAGVKDYFGLIDLILSKLIGAENAAAPA
ncbi:MAG: zinc ABC transporter substrate-binding protein [Planctomycetes bacterium]|nr:zinc ABC transporter substrate-binding protein [Planctomycetota bacterium]